MASKPKLMQVFLSQANVPGPNIFEVSGTDEGDLFCTCPGFKGRKNCKHVRFVSARIKNNNGSYPLEISTRATKEEADKAQESTEAFRDFVIKFGKIEVY
mgnify:CR=1 FL=1